MMNSDDWLPSGWSRSLRQRCAVGLLVLLLLPFFLLPLFVLLGFFSSQETILEDASHEEMEALLTLGASLRRLGRYIRSENVDLNGIITAAYELHLLLPEFQLNSSRWFPTASEYLFASRQQSLMEANREPGAPLVKLRGIIPDHSMQWLLGYYHVVEALSPLNGRSVFCRLSAVSHPVPVFDLGWRDSRDASFQPCEYVTEGVDHNRVVLFYTTSETWIITTEDQLHTPMPSSYLFAVRSPRV